MSIYNFLVPALWIAWIAVWVISARSVKETERQETDVTRLGYSLPLWAAAFLLVAGSVPLGILDERFVAHSAWLPLAATILTAIGLGFAIWARFHLGSNWSARVTVKRDHDLIRSGPYRFVRHPIYTGLLVAFLGTALLIGEWRGLVALVLVLGSFWSKLRLEERWMAETFGAAYRDYKAKVAALIPFLL
jgi:protein-S-isoprenylcysteine O-methyltransferase Ste14